MLKKKRKYAFFAFWNPCNPLNKSSEKLFDMLSDQFWQRSGIKKKTILNWSTRKSRISFLLPEFIIPEKTGRGEPNFRRS